MKQKKWLAVLLAGCITASVSGCAAQDTAVYVQSVAVLSGVENVVSGDRFPGMVVAENETEIQRDADKTVKELYVKVGENVTSGQKLFAYDTEDLQLRLDKQRLELEQLSATIENYNAQIAELEAEKKKASDSAQLQYTVQIQTLQIDLKEAELNKKNKSEEISQSEAVLRNAYVVSPVDGQIQSIKETDSGMGGTYIVIQQTGSYKVMGKLGELQRGTIQQGLRLKIEDRSAQPQVWYGTVTSVNYDSPETGDENNMIWDSTSVSSKYPFYVELDSTEGLILGQHVYLSVATEDSTYPTLNYGFLCYEEDGTTYVWADNGGKLEKRTVLVGEFDLVSDNYQILDGLTMSDYVAYPDEALCKVGAPTTKKAPVENPDEEQPEDGYFDDLGSVDGIYDDIGSVDGIYDGIDAIGGISDDPASDGANFEDYAIDDGGDAAGDIGSADDGEGTASVKPADGEASSVAEKPANGEASSATGESAVSESPTMEGLLVEES